MNSIKFILLLIVSLLLATPSTAQTNTYSGSVKDADTGEPIGYAAVGVIGGAQGEMTNDNGEFTIKVAPGKKLYISFIGYVADTIKLGSNRFLDIKLKPEPRMLKEVVVRRKRYKNKNNPAVELVKKVIAHKDSNILQSAKITHTRKYDKTMFGLNDITDSLKKKKILSKVSFVFDNTDTTIMRGKEVLPFYVREEIDDIYKQRDPDKTKQVMEAEQMVRVNGLDVDNEGLAEYTKYMYQDIDIYKNTVTFLTNGFLSPIADNATLFYRYYIQDTLMVDGEKCIKLFFAARNKADMLFTGNMYITTDGDYAVKEIEMTIDGRININWVRGVTIEQKFSKSKTRGWMKTKDNLVIDFIITEKIMGIVGKHTQLYKEIELEGDSSLTKEAQKELANELVNNTIFEKRDGYDKKDDAYWLANRLEPLPLSEAQTYQVMDSVQKVPVVRRTMIAGDIIARGYVSAGKFEIGPIYSFYGYNAVEGNRIRLGGRTTDKLTKRAKLEAYVAYGFKDDKIKYYGKAAFSFTKKSVHEFPIRSITLSYYNDTRRPGQTSNINENSVFQAIGRHTNKKLYYDETITLEHTYEFKNHMSYNVGFKYMTERPGGDIYFNYTDYSSKKNDVNYLNMSEAFVTFRWAPNEKFYQGRTNRHPLPSHYPILTLSYNVGNRIWGNDFNYHRLSIEATKRFYLSVLGFADVKIEASKTFGKAPFPELTTHISNQSWLYLNAYNLMNYLEFVSDQYVSLWIDYNAEGFFLNKIPGIRRLKLREVASLKLLYGGISRKNDPDKNNDIFKFPVKDDGTPMTYTLGSKPYIEASIGISNIFKILRIDFVKRFTYLNNPNVASWGVRAKIDMDF